VESASISEAAFELATVLTTESTEDVCAIASPFLVHLLYKVASMQLKIAHESPTAVTLEKFKLLKHALKLIGSRWLCACKYLVKD
jgi:hypothetical protein